MGIPTELPTGMKHCTRAKFTIHATVLSSDQRDWLLCSTLSTRDEILTRGVYDPPNGFAIALLRPYCWTLFGTRSTPEVIQAIISVILLGKNASS